MRKQNEIAVRMVVDGALLLTAALFGLIATYLKWHTIEPLQAFVLHEMIVPVSLVFVALPVFYRAGFYTRGRSYSVSYKPVFVAEVTALAVLIWAVAVFLFVLPAPTLRTVVAVTGISAISLTTLARLFVSFSTRHEGKEIKEFQAGGSFSEFKPKSVVVIGGAGYIGSGLLTKLLEKGYRVRLVDAFMFGDDPIKPLIGHKNLEIVRADFRQVDKIVEAMRGMDSVVHLGAIVGDPACALDEDFTIEVNLMATRLIAECAKGFGIQRFVFASTCSVYGASDEVLNEKSRLNPVSLYARSKIACERILLELTDEKFRPTILRFGTVYGLSGRTRFDLVVNLLTAKAIVDHQITVFGEDQWRPFVHVDDASLAVAMALDAPMDVVGGEIFNVGGDEGNYTLGDVGRMIKKFVPTAELIASGSDGDRRNYRVDFSKIRNRSGYKPQWTVEMGIQQVIEAFDRGLVTDYHADHYSNVKLLAAEASSKGLQTDMQRLRNMVDEIAPEQALISK